MSGLGAVIAVAAIVVFLHMSGYYVLSLIRRDASVVDIAWGLGFVLLAWVLQLSLETSSAGFWLITILVSLWGLRLGYHVFRRKLNQPSEDWRYRDMRERWAEDFVWRSFFQIFMPQGMLTLVIAAPLLLAAQHAGEFEIGWLAIIGSIIWLVGYYFEVVGDWQLSRFIAAKKRRKKPKKGEQIMTRGLWRYTRHPNYFGEVTMWWGLFVAVQSLPYGWWTIVSPLTITFLLLKVSGITMLEKKYEDNKEFARYKKRTNAFFPGPSKRR